MDKMMMSGRADVEETPRKQSRLWQRWGELHVWLHLLLPCNVLLQRWRVAVGAGKTQSAAYTLLQPPPS